MGDNILGYKGSERVRKSDAVVINTDSDVRYGKGSKFTITLPNDDSHILKQLMVQKILPQILIKMIV